MWSLLRLEIRECCIIQGAPGLDLAALICHRIDLQKSIALRRIVSERRVTSYLIRLTPDPRNEPPAFSVLLLTRQPRCKPCRTRGDRVDRNRRPHGRGRRRQSARVSRSEAIVARHVWISHEHVYSSTCEHLRFAVGHARTHEYSLIGTSFCTVS